MAYKHTFNEADVRGSDLKDMILFLDGVPFGSLLQYETYQDLSSESSGLRYRKP